MRKVYGIMSMLKPQLDAGKPQTINAAVQLSTHSGTQLWLCFLVFDKQNMNGVLEKNNQLV